MRLWSRWYHCGRVWRLQGLWASLMRLGSNFAGLYKVLKKSIWHFGRAHLVAKGHLA
jgi:hypothetical protein